MLGLGQSMNCLRKARIHGLCRAIHILSRIHGLRITYMYMYIFANVMQSIQVLLIVVSNLLSVQFFCPFIASCVVPKQMWFSQCCWSEGPDNWLWFHTAPRLQTCKFHVEFSGSFHCCPALIYMYSKSWVHIWRILSLIRIFTSLLLPLWFCIMRLTLGINNNLEYLDQWLVMMFVYRTHVYIPKAPNAWMLHA